MTDDDLKLLKSKIDKEPVKISFTDGEEVVAKILFVSDSEKDIIFDVLSTNRPSDSKDDKKEVYRAVFEEISGVFEAA